MPSSLVQTAAVPSPEIARRDLRSFTAGIEKPLLIAIARRLPAWVQPDHLTALGLFSMAGAGLCYRLVSLTPLALLGANAFLFLNWFGDSLDGTLARVREKQRPRFGFYLDHLVDAFGAIFLLVGLAASGLATPLSALGLLIAYSLLQIHIALKAHATHVFQIAFGGVGGTEARIGLAILNTLLLVAPSAQGLLTPLAWILCSGLVGLVVIDGVATARMLDREERALWARD
ncbi:MAG: CDP-alcohol phosphatidyltransferase family protein [Vicinamibacteria bacterium]